MEGSQRKDKKEREQQQQQKKNMFLPSVGMLNNKSSSICY